LKKTQAVVIFEKIVKFFLKSLLPEVLNSMLYLVIWATFQALKFKVSLEKALYQYITLFFADSFSNTSYMVLTDWLDQSEQPFNPDDFQFFFKMHLR
jgi:hypothetical protein